MKTIHGDSCIVEFVDPFLMEHVKSITIVYDTDNFSTYGKVIDPMIRQYLLSHVWE